MTPPGTMSASTSSKQPRRWARIATFGILTTALAGAVTVLTARQLAQKFSPHLAVTISPNNAPANDRLATLALAKSGVETSPASLLGFAQRSFQSQPVNAPALRNAGLAASFAGDRDKARALFLKGQHFSKRDKTASLWLFEDAIRQGDIPGGLALLDRALRVNTDVQTSIFPALTQVLAVPAAAASVAPFLERKPAWAEDYVAFAVADNSAAPIIAQLVVSHPAVAASFTETRKRTLVHRLSELGSYDLAAETYGVFTKAKATETGYDDGYFATSGWQPYDWVLGSSGNLSVFRAHKDGGLEFTVTGGGQQTVAQRLLRLDQGNYRVAGHASSEDGSLNELGLQIEIKCAGSATTLVRNTWQGANAAQLTTPFVVPANCPSQWINIYASGQRQSRTGTIGNISISR